MRFGYCPDDFNNTAKLHACLRGVAVGQRRRRRRPWPSRRQPNGADHSRPRRSPTLRGSEDHHQRLRRPGAEMAPAW